jgi:hypothetical protein
MAVKKLGLHLGTPLGKPLCQDSLPRGVQERQEKVKVGFGSQDEGEGVSDPKEVMEIGSCVPMRGDRRKVRLVAGVAEVADAFPGVEEAVAGIAGGKDAVHHIHACSDGLQDILR